MFEVKCFVTVDVLVRGLALRTPGEREYLEAFDKMRALIMDAAKRAYSSNPQAAVLLDVSNFTVNAAPKGDHFAAGAG